MILQNNMQDAVGRDYILQAGFDHSNRSFEYPKNPVATLQPGCRLHMVQTCPTQHSPGKSWSVEELECNTYFREAMKSSISRALDGFTRARPRAIVIASFLRPISPYTLARCQ